MFQMADAWEPEIEAPTQVQPPVPEWRCARAMIGCRATAVVVVVVSTQHSNSNIPALDNDTNIQFVTGADCASLLRPAHSPARTCTCGVCVYVCVYVVVYYMYIFNFHPSPCVSPFLLSPMLVHCARAK